MEQKILNAGPSGRGWHRLQLASECLQKYAWTYKPGAEKTESTSQEPASPPLILGGLFHLALAQHYARMRATQHEEDPEAWVHPEQAVAQVALEKGPAYVKAVAQVQSVYRSYVRAYPHDSREMKILDVEDLAEVTISGKYRLTGRFDLSYEDAGGRVYVVDHKTTGRITPNHKLFYSISGQLLGYGLMARQKYKERYAGFKINLVQLGDQPEFQRIDLPRSPNLEAQFEQRVVDIERSVEQLEEEGRPYQDWPKAMSELTCFHRYGPCPFMEKCRFGEGAMAAGQFTFSFDSVRRSGT